VKLGIFKSISSDKGDVELAVLMMIGVIELDWE
jgi:hypothetical protein